MLYSYCFTVHNSVYKNDVHTPATNEPRSVHCDRAFVVCL